MSEGTPIEFSPPMSPDEVRKQTKISDDFYTVYSNHARITFSQTDFRVFVGEIYLTSTSKTEIVENFCIAMSPQQAKAVLEVLQGTVAAYEKTFGAIPPLKIVPQQTPAAEPAERKQE